MSTVAPTSYVVSDLRFDVAGVQGRLEGLSKSIDAGHCKDLAYISRAIRESAAMLATARDKHSKS